MNLPVVAERAIEVEDESEEEEEEQFNMHSKVWFDVSVEGRHVGRLNINVFAETTKTSDNFFAICEGKTKGPDGKLLTYEGNSFHRVIPRYLM